MSRRRLSAGALILTVVLALGRARAAQDPRLQWLEDHVIPIDGRDGPDAFAAAVGDARIVQLGEATHGDGTAFLVRGRLVSYLHERAGFDRLAFESGFFECRAVDSLLSDAGVPLPQAIDQGIYPIWAHSAQIQPLFKWLRATRGTSRPAYLGCFDIQFSAQTTAERLLAGLDHVLGGPAGWSRHRPQVREVVRLVGGAGEYDVSEEDAANLAASLRELREVLAGAGRPAGRWWERVLDGLAAAIRSLVHQSRAPPFDPRNPERTIRSPHAILSANARDRAMAQQLRWLVEDAWLGHRSVVWAANSHVAYRSSLTAVAPLEQGSSPQYRPMGDYLRQWYGDEVYTILTVAYAGTWAAPSIQTAEGELRWTDGVHPPAESGTLADLLHRAGIAVGLLDLRALRGRADHWLHQPLVVRQDMFGGRPVRLADVADAILFIDTMDPSTPRS